MEIRTVGRPGRPNGTELDANNEGMKDVTNDERI